MQTLPSTQAEQTKQTPIQSSPPQPNPIQLCVRVRVGVRGTPSDHLWQQFRHLAQFSTNLASLDWAGGWVRMGWDGMGWYGLVEGDHLVASRVALLGVVLIACTCMLSALLAMHSHSGLKLGGPKWKLYHKIILTESFSLSRNVHKLEKALSCEHKSVC